MDKSTARTAARAQGATITVEDKKTDYFHFPSEEKLLNFREWLPFRNLYSGGSAPNRHTLIVYWDMPKKIEDVTEVMKCLSRVQNLEYKIAILISTLKTGAILASDTGHVSKDAEEAFDAWIQEVRDALKIAEAP